MYSMIFVKLIKTNKVASATVLYIHTYFLLQCCLVHFLLLVHNILKTVIDISVRKVAICCKSDIKHHVAKLVLNKLHSHSFSHLFPCMMQVSTAKWNSACDGGQQVGSVKRFVNSNVMYLDPVCSTHLLASVLC